MVAYIGLYTELDFLQEVQLDISYHQESLALKGLLLSAIDRNELVGGTRFTMGGMEISIESKDGIGKLIEEWLGLWARERDVNINENIDGGSQEFPDYYIGADRAYLEVKTFDLSASANFDIANFESYCESLSYHPERLLSDYLIVGYRLSGSYLKIEKVWLKKIWELSSPSARYPIKVQVKRDVIYNIRPTSWYSKRSTYSPFRSWNDFVEALYGTQKIYLDIDSSEDEERFFSNIS